MASSSSFSNCWRYDVFLNFRGEDTRKIFVGHLYKALDQKAISTFIDAEELRKGNDISELLMCIQESRLSIVVLSQNYAASTWCLKELVKILECLDTRQQIVVPVFYQVDPSHVRKLETSFAQAFAEYEHDHNSRNEDVQTWKSAITRVANLSGWDSRHYKDDAKLIDDIVEDVFNKLIHISSSNVNSLVGMGSHLSEMDLLLCPDKINDVRVIGIWGMGGLGKTTIARAVYDKIACNFEHCCFLENVNEGFLKKGKAQMQELESRLFKAKVQSLGILNRCSNMIINRLGKKKVFLVLDDVDSCAQIETLIGKHSFGGGSRIIITTRDKQSLSGVDATYSPSFLSGNEALKLFRQHAFRTNQPSGQDDHLLQRAIEYAQGLPLALKVLGAFLDNKSVREWEDVLEKIKKIPHRGIQDVLITSFDGLDDLEKDIFLDIACFFKGISKGYVTKILDGCGFFCHSGLRVLVDRALVTISDWNMLEMHDLLQEMGREIVRQESAKEPGRRSRLWSYEDAKKVLTQNTATEAVEGIFLDLSKSKEVSLHTEGFVRMTKLRLLKIYNSGDDPSDDCKQHVSGDLKFLSPELRLLLWHGFPLKSLPSNFQPKNLVDLDMRYSLIEQLWEGTKPLTKLNFINLSHSQYLIRIPDFSEAPNLERLNLEGCICLSEVHPSISALRKLVFLSLKGCKELKSLSSSSIGMKSLKTLNLSGCSSLEKFPKISAVMKELSELCLDDTAIKQLPSSINNLTGLVTLNLRGCRELKILPSRIHMKSLKHLYLEGCSNLEKFPEISEVMKELSQLYLDETAIKELPSSIEQLEGLEILSLRNCRSLSSLPDTICNLENLTELYLAGCSELCNLPKNLGNLEFLRDLEIEGSGVRQLPLSMLRLKFETLSSASWPSSIPEYSSFSDLLRLNLSDCNLLELSDGIAHLCSLQTLELSRNNFESLPATMNQLGLLTRLNLEACKRLKSIPELSSSIKYIDAHDCTALETVSKPKPQDHTHHCFTFSNCLQLVQTNLFNDIVETHCLCQDNCLQVLSFEMSLPGNEIPDWFNHQCSGSSVTVQLPPDWLCNQFFGFAICANFKGANIHASHHLSAGCFCTLKGNHGETAFSFDLLRWRFKNDRFLESDHLFQGYVSWSKFRLVEQGKPINERYYTEATFEIVVDNEIYAPEFSTVIQHHRITSCGVRFFTRPKCDHDRCEILLATMKKRKRERKIEPGQRRSRRGV